MLERCFGDIDFRSKLLAKRDDAFRRTQIDTTTSVTYIEGAAYKDVVRTWIYLANILDWYDGFNTARNNIISEHGLLGNSNFCGEVEQLYLPASTGIGGNNSWNLPVTMDVFAAHRSSESTVHIHSLSGSKQCSPYRYGSAFSRAIVVENLQSKMIFVSGRASIDEQGKSVFLGNADAQIRHSLNVVFALIAEEGATLHDICETTVFFKRKEDNAIYEKIAEQLGITHIPAVHVIADVCRDELLFELDAAFSLET